MEDLIKMKELFRLNPCKTYAKCTKLNGPTFNEKSRTKKVLKLEEKVLERLDFDLIELRKMMLAKWLLNEGRLKLPYTVSGIEGIAF